MCLPVLKISPAQNTEGDESSDRMRRVEPDRCVAMITNACLKMTSLLGDKG